MGLPPELRTRLSDRLERLCRRIAPAGGVTIPFSCLETGYAEPPRAYHNLEHVAACLHVLDQVSRHCTRPELVEFALWLHDAVYEPLARDNEERSATVARGFLRGLGAADDDRDRVEKLILATKHDLRTLTGDDALIADIDLAVLAAPSGEYDAYAAAIRVEYGMVPDEQFRAGRAKVLQGLLDRPHIFCTEWFRERCEASARANLAREIGQLRS